MNINLLRECSNVQRCHTIPHQGEYTVGKHSYDATVLLLALFPDISRNALTYMLLHDTGERWVGDIPCTAAWDDGALGKAYKAAEERVRLEHGIVLPEVTPDELHLIQVVDKLELWLWAYEQRLLWGNLHVVGCCDRLGKYFDGLAAEGRLPEPVGHVLLTHMSRRSS